MQVGKAIAEHPESLDLLFFQLSLLHFVYADVKQVSLSPSLSLSLSSHPLICREPLRQMLSVFDWAT